MRRDVSEGYLPNTRSLFGRRISFAKALFVANSVAIFALAWIDHVGFEQMFCLFSQPIDVPTCSESDETTSLRSWLLIQTPALMIVLFEGFRAGQFAIDISRFQGSLDEYVATSREQARGDATGLAEQDKRRMISRLESHRIHNYLETWRAIGGTIIVAIASTLPWCIGLAVVSFFEASFSSAFYWLIVVIAGAKSAIFASAFLYETLYVRVHLY